MPGTSDVLDDSLPELRRIVEAQLDRYVTFPDDCPARLQEAMRYSLLGGGKRLRPVLVLLASEACGGTIEDALPAACAIEMIHTYSLIHDDLPAMDNDDLRRGRPTCHKQFDEATAILAGDGLLTLAFDVIARDVRPPEVAAACCLDLASAAGAIGMVGGQVADLAAEGRWGDRPDASSGSQAVTRLEAIHRRKTGRLLSCALTLGGRIASATQETLRRLQIYGDNVGLAFQIADDLLDVGGNAAKMGKGVQKDAELGKLTYPGLLGVSESRRRAELLIEQACSQLQPLGPAARKLELLARFVIERDT
ncbi:MAG: polyprenyl synthetase family protein [Planctomycetaceae bacterium]|nr:polyprenyl synthetase family protein [Planctomycetaceae bacterium]